MRNRISFALLAFFAVALGLALAGACSAEEVAQPFVRVYDTATQSRELLSGIAPKRNWKEIPEGKLDCVFQGQTVLLNDRLMLILGEPYDAEIYPVSPSFFAAFRVLTAGQPQTVRFESVRLLENSPAAATAETVYRAEDGRTAVARYRLAAGQAILEVRPGDGAENLVLLTSRGHVVVPDFFGDDRVLPHVPPIAGPVSLPAENAILTLADDGHAIVMATWQARNLLVKAESSRGATGIMFPGYESRGAKGKPIWVAFLEGPGLWHEQVVKPADGAAVAVLDWSPPFAAKWRADRIGKDGFAESQTFETPPALAAGRYVIYPLDRTRATPLTEFTPVDILRNTLGVGPCQYILETEGLASADNPTPDNVMTWVEKQLKKKGGKDAADEIRERLKAMAELIARTDARIKRYADFASEMKQVLASENSEEGRKLKATVDALALSAATGLAATQPPGRVAKLTDAVAGLIGKDTALADATAPAAELRAIGAAQDRALAKSRMAVRWLGCQAQSLGGLAAAKQIVNRTEAFLQGK